MKKRKAFLFVTIILLHNCATVYTGDYPLQNSLDQRSKVKLKIKYDQNLLFCGHQYNYKGFDTYHIWSLHSKDYAPGRNMISEEDKFECYYTILLDSGNYYGVDDLNNKDQWVKLDGNDIVKVSKTKNQYLKNIVYQDNNYYGVPDLEEYDNLILIDENQVVKLSKYDPAVSVLASILAAPVVVLVLWASLAAADDDW